MSNFDVYCPNVSDMTTEEIIAAATPNKYVLPTQQRFALVDLIYSQVLKFNLEKDLLLALLDESDKQLLLALAGGGKTTTLVAKAVFEKIWRKSRYREGRIKGDNMLFLVYNEGNVKDIRAKHSKMVSQLKTSGIQGCDFLDSNLQVFTMHKFCKSWINQYQAECNIVNYKLMNMEESQALMTIAITNQIKINNLDIDVRSINLNNLLGLYNIRRECLLDYQGLTSLDKFIDLDLPIEVIESTFNGYDVVKRLKKRYDFTDMLSKFYDLITGEFDVSGKCNHREILERIQHNYEYITADEYQDFTPLLLNIIKLLSEDCPLVCIGDDDQAIYGFRGADNNNALNFPITFPDSKVLLLKTNRRCPKNIVELSNHIVSFNKNRFNKDMRSIKPDGGIFLKPFSDRNSQVLSILELIESMPDEEKNSTCICYRNKELSKEIVNKLLENGIHFHVLSGVPPYSYGLFRAVMDVLTALSVGVNKRLTMNLYKCLPITKKELQECLAYNEKNDNFDDGKEIMLLSEIDFGNKMKSSTFKAAFEFLLKISENMNKDPMSVYFPDLLYIIKRYYWDYVAKTMNIPAETDIEFTASVDEMFNVNRTFNEKFIELEKDKSLVKRDQISRNGVCLSTFHALKGLEYKNVIMMDMKESVFPNSSFIELKPYSKKLKESLLESETRLCYVGITRAKENLYVYYDKTDPSIYATYIIDYLREAKEGNPLESLSTLQVATNFTSSTEKIEEVEEEYFEDEYNLNIDKREEEEEVMIVAKKELTLDEEKKIAGARRSALLGAFFR